MEYNLCYDIDYKCVFDVDRVVFWATRIIKDVSHRKHRVRLLYPALAVSDTTKNHGRLGGIRQTPGYLQNQPCHLPKETGVQLLCAASYDIWCRDMDTDQTSTELTCGRTDKNGKKYAQHHIASRLGGN